MPDLSERKRALLKALLEKEGLLQNPSAIPQHPAGTAPLSFAQERLWYLEQFAPGSPAYNIPLAYRLSGELDPTGLESAFNQVVSRHDTLRTRFPLIDVPSQIVLDSLALQVPITDLIGAGPDEINRRIKAEAVRPFSLAAGPLLRAALLKTTPQEHILLLTIHHIIADGWSLAILLRELSSAYNAVLRGKTPSFEPLNLQYVDFAHWQRNQASGPAFESELAYWKDRLSGNTATLELPLDFARPAIQSFRGRWLAHTLPEAVGTALFELARSQGVTLLSVVLAAFKVLLYRYTGQTDILVGSPVTNRTRTELEYLVGHFVNTQALRTELSGEPTFLELVGRVRETLLGAYANQDVPFERLLDVLDTGRDPGKNPLFQTVFILQDAPAHAHWRTALQLENLAIESIFTHSDTAKFDLAVEMEVLPDGLTVSFEYSTDLFEENTIRRMAGHFETLLTSAAAHPDRTISSLQLLTDEETAELTAWNDTATVYPRDETIHALFEQQVRQAPDAIALTFQGRQMTYAQLNRRANHVAHQLLARGVGPDHLVGIAAERSLELIIGTLGILKAGAAYLPLDTNYPSERIGFMLADSQTQLVLVQEGLAGSLKQAGSPASLFLDPFLAEPPIELAGDPAVPTTAGHSAYVMYTSGSTGRPKGAVISHRSVVRLVRETSYLKFKSSSVFLQFSPVSFDAATFEIWGALLNGGMLAISPPGQLSFEALGRLIASEQVTSLWLTSGLFHEMVEQYPQSLASVEQVLTGGDVVSPKSVRALFAHKGSAQILNAYGPTENTTFTTTYRMESPDDAISPLPIGGPISNTTTYILDAYLRPLPVGITGELYTGGDGLARGYLNRPGLTADRFLPDPFLGNGTRMYRTGDLARWRQDGTIDFLGRRDFQVKLRGFRIELGEIEAALRKLAGVRDVAIIARTGSSSSDKKLVAYLIPDGETAPTVGDLRTDLAAHLPDYMIPAAFVFLAEFPLTENGKLDRRALPEPAGDRPSLSTTFSAPKTEAEQTIAAIWREVLKVEQTGLDDNFFDLGGHSLLMLQVHARLKEIFQREIPMIEMFTYPTIRSMAERLSLPGEDAPEVDLGARGAARRERMERRRK